MNLQSILAGDTFKRCHSITKCELKDLINMREKCLPNSVAWDNVKHNHVTTGGKTIWQLSEKFINESYQGERPIGLLEPPISFLKEILNNIN